MKELIDVTHTVKASAAPSEGARYMFDPATNARFWVSDAAAPELLPEGKEVPPPPEDITEPGDEEGLYSGNPSPEVPLVSEPDPYVPRKPKKPHHGS